MKLSKMIDGEEVILEEQEDLIKASEEENFTRFTRCHTCSFLQGQLLDDIGLLAEGPGVSLILKGHSVIGLFNAWSSRISITQQRSISCLYKYNVIICHHYATLRWGCRGSDPTQIDWISQNFQKWDWQ